MTKKVEKEITIAADADTVWRAVSEGEELKRWFTLDARVNPGAGGSVWMSFGEGASWETPIVLWEPGKHLRTADEVPGATAIAVDYFIESRGGETVLRLVHSGFADDTWEGELDNLNAGWAAFLENLKHYLERHPGEPRFVAYFRHPAVALPRPEVYARTMRALGLDPEHPPRAGEPYEGNLFRGVTRVSAPPVNFTGTAENWSDGWLMVEIEPGKEKCRPAIWVSLYGEARREGDALQQRITELLQRAFADVGTPAS